MIFTLLNHQLKEFMRSRDAGRSIVLQILMIFTGLYFLLVGISVGFFMADLLEKVFPDRAIIPAFCGLLLYYFAFDIILRMLFQELPTLAVQPYLIQNIRRGQLVAFLNVRSLFNLFNILPFILILPYVFIGIGKEYGLPIALLFALSIISICFFNHFIVLFLKRKTIISSWWLVGVVAAVLLLAGADHFNIISVHTLSETVFMALVRHIWLSIVTVIMFAAAFYNNQRFLLSNLYVEELVKAEGQKQGRDYTWLNSLGNSGDLMALDIKLILRHKRPRNVIFSSIAILFYGFFLYKPVYLENDQFGRLLFGAILITGVFITSYGSLLFAWQTAQFDGLMSSNISMRSYIKSKLTLITTFSTVILLISLLYGFRSWKIIPVEIAAYLFNIGINAVLCTFFATRSYKGVDLNKAAKFNYEGASAARYFYPLFIAFLATLLYLPFAVFINSWAGIIAMGVAGLLSFLLREWWIDLLTAQFKQQKYQILEGFRET